MNPTSPLNVSVKPAPVEARATPSDDDVHLADRQEKTVAGWAKQLGVAEADLRYELGRGLTMQGVVDRLRSDYYESRKPSRPVAAPPRPQLSTFSSNHRVPGYRAPTYSVTGDCASCMAILRDDYEVMHRAHLESVPADKEATHRAEVKAGKRPAQ